MVKGAKLFGALLEVSSNQAHTQQDNDTQADQQGGDGGNGGIDFGSDAVPQFFRQRRYPRAADEDSDNQLVK